MPPFHIIGVAYEGDFVISVDHASNRVPSFVNDGELGVGPEDMARHISYDVGAAGVAFALSEHLKSPAVLSNFSRLVIDPNRSLLDPTLIMKLYDGTLIPANRSLSADQIATRNARLYQPYHDALQTLLTRQPKAALLAIHSFTPCLHGSAPRPWHIGVLYAKKDPHLSQAIMAELAKEADLTVGDNEPYVGALPGDSIDQHALQQGRHNSLIEIRNDLINTKAKQVHWAARLAPIFMRAFETLTPR
ncbi:MAG TPA: N-formylglutamate amidohydrolase [Rhodobacter sp.]|jgi:predicted N-formylglutamate amidohydrolase|nr:MAG: N-formylglutamate amidohydrolase [Rhodobacter sp. BACL10 MAG-120910-bin24]KRO90750.1 MAG: N-formylglutamate amidohydrolase [Rhodobacter sp. BACL10 MAG-121220-bin24]KRP25174.1 MAG: N-formylglutamate amidohydrolase [Rhodobacter sp. BACL10 MAG-120419-bin15]NQV67619.1 N-formylglutamate amidohydrolase [Paracoccaceae bacterium]HAG26174.1 N-formylglutamate amidohydrolase [Rhodobacter sp.]